MNLSDHAEFWTLSTTTHNAWPAHTWIPSWTGPYLAALRKQVLHAGWEWQLVGDADDDLPLGHSGMVGELTGPRMLGIEDDRELVRGLTHIARHRYARQVRPAAVSLSPRRMLLAVGPGFSPTPDLDWLARLGRSVGIRLAVAIQLRTEARISTEFRDNITGFWDKDLRR